MPKVGETKEQRERRLKAEAEAKPVAVTPEYGRCENEACRARFLRKRGNQKFCCGECRRGGYVARRREDGREEREKAKRKLRRRAVCRHCGYLIADSELFYFTKASFRRDRQFCSNACKQAAYRK